MSSKKSLFILFLIGATVGSFFDGFHTHSGTTAYPHPWILQMAWWVPLLFGAATVAIGISHPSFDETFHRKRTTPGWPKAVLGMICFGLLYYGTGFLLLPEPWKTLTIAGGALLIWFIFDTTTSGLFLALMTGLIGSGVEITLVHFGAFRYLKPDIFGIPYWLPFLYIGASVAVGNLGRKLSQ